MDSHSNNNKRSMIFILRHGERADCAGPEENRAIEIPVDPHLTELGKLQAKYAADEIQKMVEKETKSPVKYLVVSSPFLRCLQTANSVAQGLGKDRIVNQQILYDNFLSEFLGTLYFASSPMDNLYIRKKSEDLSKHITMDLKEGVIEGKHTVEVAYPESSGDLFRRISKGYEKTLEFFREMIKKEKEAELVLVLVTHGYGVQAFLDYYEAFDFAKEVDYTCLSQIYYNPETKEATPGIVQHHEQLKKAQEEYNAKVLKAIGIN